MAHERKINQSTYSVSVQKKWLTSFKLYGSPIKSVSWQRLNLCCVHSSLLFASTWWTFLLLFCHEQNLIKIISRSCVLSFVAVVDYKYALFVCIFLLTEWKYAKKELIFKTFFFLCGKILLHQVYGRLGYKLWKYF